MQQVRQRQQVTRRTAWSFAAGCDRKADAMSLVHAVEVARRRVSLLEPVIGPSRYAQLVTGT